MTTDTAQATAREAAGVEQAAGSDTALMARALALYRPDIGLAIHRALEARHLKQEHFVEPILDLGCSDGKFASLWSGAGGRPVRVLGCDLSLAELRRARAAPSPLQVFAGDGGWLPLRDRSLGTVIANSMLTHVPDVNAVLTEIARVLRPGGLLIASVPGPAFEDQLASVRILRGLRLHWLAHRAGDRYHLLWQQWHRDGRTVWGRRLAAHGFSLVEARLYPGNRAGLIWSLAFCLIRAGVSRYTILNALGKLWPGWSSPHRGRQVRVGILARKLAPLLAGPGSAGGSLFLVARKAHEVQAPGAIGRPRPPRVPPECRRPDMAATLDWLTRSRIRIAEDEAAVLQGGYANMTGEQVEHMSVLYCEITGYAAQFWLRQSRPDALRLAEGAGNCLLRVQVPADGGQMAGAFPFGLTRPNGAAIPGYFSFDAAVCASAMVDLCTRTGEISFADAAQRAGEFVIRMQKPQGTYAALRTLQPDHPGFPRDEGWFGDGCALHGKNAIALLKLWHVTGESRWRTAACRTLDWACSLQTAHGGFPWHADSSAMMSHTHCYATEGLLYAGLALGEDRYLTAGVRGAEWLRFAQRPDGGLHQHYRAEAAGIPRPLPGGWVHIGPAAQAARIWWVAAQVSPGRAWEEAAKRALGFLARAQVRCKDPWGGGAFPQTARGIGPWLRGTGVFSPWEAMFASEAVRLWTTGTDDPDWSIF